MVPLPTFDVETLRQEYPALRREGPDRRPAAWGFRTPERAQKAYVVLARRRR